MVQAAVSQQLYKEVYDLSLDFPISQSPRYKPHTFTDPATATETETEPAKAHNYLPESEEDDKKDRVRPYSALPPARNEQPVKPLRGLNKGARGWYCFLGEIIEVYVTDDGKNWLIEAADRDRSRVPIVFADTRDNDELFRTFESAIQPGHVVMILFAKRHRLGEEEDSGECIWVENRREVKFFETSVNYLSDLEHLLSQHSRAAQAYRRTYQCFGCRMSKYSEELIPCPDCGMFWFCDKPADDHTTTTCHEMALTHRDHFDVCSLLGDPDVYRLFSGRHRMVDRFLSPVVRRNFLVGST
ncbi:hypothetical protein BJX68DRAFT_264700 [Aspergillus pseudodeflectus]|uniref:MYND-type zinc finger protein samB n=1 Tax=Aspergillus pseudodeflectus TaxID=176178 RepID=A0ABR4KRC4_9EURO